MKIKYYLVTNKNKIVKLKMMELKDLFMINHEVVPRLK